MAAELTDSQIRSLEAKGPAKRTEYPDAIVKGLRLRHGGGERGKMAWYLRASYKGKPLNERLGHWPQMSLRDARLSARDMLDQIKAGTFRKAGAKTEAPAKMTFAELCEEYVASSKFRRNKTWHEREKHYRNQVIPALGAIPLDELTKKAVREKLTEPALQRGAESMSRELLTLVKTALTYAEECEYIEDSPVFRMKMPVGPKSRSRVLTIQEIQAFWWDLSATRVHGDPIPRALKWCLMTAQRKSECAFITEKELRRAERLWVLPGDRVKNAEDNLVPLTDWHLQFLGEADEDTGLFFLSGKSKSGRIDARSMNRHVRTFCERADIEPNFWVHDLRRTVATMMRRLGVERPVVRAILNHTEGDVTAVYDRYDLLREKRQAMATWVKWLRAAVEERKSVAELNAMLGDEPADARDDVPEEDDDDAAEAA